MRSIQKTRMGTIGLAMLAWRALAPFAAPAGETTLTVREPGEAARAPARVTTGIPFARGALKEVEALTVSLDGQPIPAQFRAHVPWDDGSVRWALMHTLVAVEEGGMAQLTVAPGGGSPEPPQRARAIKEDRRVRMTTGPMELAVSARTPGWIEAVTVNGQTLAGGGRGPVLVLEDGQTIVAGPPSEVAIEEAGPVRAVALVRGGFPDVHDGLLRYTARIEAWAGQTSVQIAFRLENHGALGVGDTPGEWFSFRAMGVEFGLDLGDSIQATCEGVQATGAFHVLQQCLETRDRELGRGVPRYTWEDFKYTVSSGDTELATGDRTDGIVRLEGEKGRVTAAIREFWKEYEKAIELENDALRFWLWPAEGQWPKPLGGRWDPRYLSSGVRDKEPQEGLYRLPGGLRKEHVLVLDFSGADEAVVAAEINTPLFALASAETYAATDAAPGLFAPAGVRVEKNREANFKLASWERMQRSATDPDNPTSLFAARKTSWQAALGYQRENGLWYGWMDFGDISVPGRGQIGVDEWSQQIFLNALRFGDLPALRLGLQMTRHTRDIDQLWSDRDLPHVRGMQKRHALPQHHVPHLNERRFSPGNRLAGLALHYMLTGDSAARKACLRNGESLIEAWKILSPTRRFHPIGPVANTISAYTTLYELTADKRWLNEAMALFNTHIDALRERHGPHLHSAQQIGGQSYGRQDQAYCLAIQWLCELHHATGDESVLKLLQEGCEREFNKQNYYDAPTYLSGLFAYVGLQTGNEQYLRQASSLFAESFPESRSPPVFMPGNSQWHNVAGRLLRSGHLLQYGWWKTGRKNPD